MNVCLVDGSNLAFKSYSVLKESRSGLLTNSFGVPTTCIFGLIRTFNALVDKRAQDRIIVCWDVKGGSYYRKKLYPLYKKNRIYTDMKDYFDELNACREHLDQFGFNQASATGIEGDDVIGYLSRKYSDEGHKVLIVSDDKDFFQLVRKNVKIFRPCKDEIVNLDQVIEDCKVKPFQLAKLKAITGEDVDFIPGICDVDIENKKLIKVGLGPAAAIKILGTHKTLNNAIDAWQDAPKAAKQWGPILKAKRDNINISYKLARIRTKDKMYGDWELKLLHELKPRMLEQRTVKFKTVQRLAVSLEFKTLSIPMILKKLGIDVKGGSGL